ncbi:unnamed protein product [Orchesella dallaii]|uniref:Solute carrier family 13 member 2 n=1 Tax=Orchesella dallaii TaxID=48710 RepID=A0ABP1R9S7_9HEXA
MQDDYKIPSGLFARLRWRLGLNWRLLFGIALPIVLLPLVFLKDDDIVELEHGETKKSTKFRAAYAIMIVALYWMLEVMPLAVTSLLPLVLFPFLGVLDTSEVAPSYFKETNVMFFGGLVLALAVEYCNLHRRIALKVMTIVGSSPVRLLFGVMMTAMFLSMWMSNTACTAMMLPILIAVLDQLAGNTSDDKPSDKPDSGPNKRYSISHGPTENPVSVTVDSDDRNINRTGSTEKLIREQKRWENVRKMYMFGVAYACNIGGTATITGTGPNLVFQDVIKSVDVGQNGKYLDMTFANWMALNVPATLINVFVAFSYLVFMFYGIKWRELPLLRLCLKPSKKSAEEMDDEEEEKKKQKSVNRLLKDEYEKLGPMNFHEFGVLIIFIFVVILWIFRDPKFMDGWNNVLKDADIGDATAAVLGIVLMFLVPRDMTFITGIPRKGQAYEALLDWKFVQHHLSWGVVLLLGGGFAISDGAEKSGLSAWIGDQLTGLDELPRPLILLIVMVLTAGITEVCSNVATANVLLPILITLSRTLNIHPLYLTVPATISCSFAFMLPVATPPNALVFAAGNLRIADMLKTGLFLNIACTLVFFLVQISYGELFFGYSSYEYGSNATTTRLIRGIM